ncbi:MAG: DUF2442 domain-containing protein [Actinomycetota bacterium]|nr:DUF2442 domain-containing protein [Actinomycetota bacterium]MDK1038602.1 DUF2442 domain-containing protein [Actinomycetota bacterium]
MKVLEMVDITNVEIIAERTVRLWFSDGSMRVVDLLPYLWGPALGELATNNDLFSKIAVDPEIGTISWPNGSDLDPDILHGDHEPASLSGTAIG